MQPLADILIIADEDKIYGVEKGYYPTLKDSLDNGNLLLVPYGEWRDCSLRLKTSPRCDGTDVYIRNPYSNCYISSSDNELLDEFCEDKSQVIKEALVRLGAKHIIVKEEVKDEERLNASLDTDAKAGTNRGSLNTKFSRMSSMDLKTCIESHDPDRKPMSFQKVDEFLRGHGLAHDTKLQLLAERLRDNGHLSGHEKYTVKYLNEVQFALSILAKIDYKVFSSKLDFSLEQIHLHTISKELDITF